MIFICPKTGNKLHIWKGYSILHGKHIKIIEFGVNMQKIFKFEFWVCSAILFIGRGLVCEETVPDLGQIQI